MDKIIQIKDVTKIYKMYERTLDRFKETFHIGGKSYGKEFYALDNVSFDIARGETVGIIGRNGSGKSTILKILTGVLNPTHGEVRVDGKISALLELGAGFNMEYTGRENIYLNATIMGVSREEIEKKVPEILEFADIGDHIDQPVKTYSSGMFVRLAFAVAINVDPEILIVDEALAVGDTRFQLKCMDKFVEFMKAGKTVLFVSHDINSIKRFCSRSIWLNSGKVVMDGPTDEVTDRYMDFLKSEKTLEEFLDSRARVVELKQEAAQKILEDVDIATIDGVTLLNDKDNVIGNVEHGEEVRVKIGYYVSDTSIENPVLGVAIRSIDNEYICGINTLLDKISIPWERGYNEMILSYHHFNLVGGEYYFDVALFDSTATVNIDYRSKIRTFVVNMEYIAEGVVVLQHDWKK